MTGLAAVAAPILGGAVTQGLGWRAALRVVTSHAFGYSLINGPVTRLPADEALVTAHRCGEPSCH